YVVISGTGTLITGGTIVNGRKSAADNEVTTILNGPSCNGTMVGFSSRVINVGDIIVIPEGVPHGFSAIPDHITYLSVRPDLKKVLKKGYVNPALASKQRSSAATAGAVATAGTRSIPTFEVARNWPKVPAQWKLGDVSSFAVDAKDNVWLVHRPRTLVKPEDVPKRAPAVMEFDNAGNYIKA